MDGKGRTPRWRHTEHERFARAVEGGPQPVDGDDFADDLAIVELLRRMDVGPDAETRERMKQRVLTAPPPDKPLVLSSVRRVGARARLAVAAAAVLCLLMSLGGMSVLLSRDALPGDPLYGVKRTAEGATLGLTFDDESRALKHLEFAAARVTEMETLADRGAKATDQLTALGDLEADAVEGTRQLTAYGTSADKTVLPSLREWALAQYMKLGTLRPRLPESAGERADTAMWLLAGIAQRAHDLAARAACDQVIGTESDPLGPLPSKQECASVTDPNTAPGRESSVQPTAPGVPQPSGSTQPSQGPTNSILPGTSTPSSSQPGTSTPPASGKPGITIPLPLPLPSISLPLLPGISFG